MNESSDCPGSFLRHDYWDFRFWMGQSCAIYRKVPSGNQTVVGGPYRLPLLNGKWILSKTRYRHGSQRSIRRCPAMNCWRSSNFTSQLLPRWRKITANYVSGSTGNWIAVKRRRSPRSERTAGKRFPSLDDFFPVRRQGSPPSETDIASGDTGRVLRKLTTSRPRPGSARLHKTGMIERKSLSFPSPERGKREDFRVYLVLEYQANRNRILWPALPADSVG